MSTMLNKMSLRLSSVAKSKKVYKIDSRSSKKEVNEKVLYSFSTKKKGLSLYNSKVGNKINSFVVLLKTEM